MYFLLGFFVALGLFLSMQSNQQEIASQERALAYQRVKAAEQEYPNMLAGWKNAYAEFDRLKEENDVRAFPREFTGKWIEKNQWDRKFIEFDDEGVLTHYTAMRGDSCFRRNKTLDLVRYSKTHYFAEKQYRDNRLIITGDRDAINIQTVQMTVRADSNNYIRIDYREEDQYIKCKARY